MFYRGSLFVKFKVLILFLFILSNSIIAQENTNELDLDCRDLMDSDNGSQPSLNELLGAWKAIELPNNLNIEVNEDSKYCFYYYFSSCRVAAKT